MPLPPGEDPADAADGFEARLERAEPYALYRVRIEIQNAPDRQAAYERARETLDRAPESPERQDAWRYANDKLGMTVQIRAAGRARRSSLRRRSRRGLLEAASRLERDALAGWLAHPEALVPLLAELDSRALRRRAEPAHARGWYPGTEPEEDLLPVIAELSARAEAEEMGSSAAKQRLLMTDESEHSIQGADACPTRRREIGTPRLERTRARETENLSLQSSRRRAEVESAASGGALKNLLSDPRTFL